MHNKVYIEERERCFDVMFSFVEALLPADLTVLDLAAGPGAIRPGGILLNGDGMGFAADQRRIEAAVDVVDQRRQQRAITDGAEAWTRWWDALRIEASLQEAFAERERIFPNGSIPADEDAPTLAFHVAALLESGF